LKESSRRPEIGLLPQVILPLFALASVGYLLGRRQVNPAPLTFICLYLLLPLLLFSSLVRSPLGAAEAGRYIAWFALQVTVNALAVTALARWRGWPAPERSALTLALTSFNIGSYGVPVVLFALDEAALSGAMLLLVCSNISSGTFGVYIAAGGRQSPLAALGSVFRLPLVYVAALALTLNYLGLSLPETLLDSVAWIGRVGPVVAMVILGIQLAQLPLSGIAYRRLTGGIALKMVWGPAVGVTSAWLLGTQGAVFSTLLICSFLPTAINTLLLAVRFNSASDLLAAVLLGSTLLSPLGIGIALWYIQ
jgi:malate permease and related proteins